MSDLGAKEDKQTPDTNNLKDPNQQNLLGDGLNKSVNADLSMRSDEGKHLNPTHLPSTFYHLMGSHDSSTNQKSKSRFARTIVAFALCQTS